MNRIILNFIYLPNYGHVNKWFNMGQHIIPKIKENYSFYNKLLSERKSVFSELIEINKVGNNYNELCESIETIHPSINDDKLELSVLVKVNNHDHFYFKLKYREFVKAPFFRFDSDGTTHHNRIDGIPLSKQAITTPHFHKFNENGIEIAYKTDKLLDPRESKALEDINLCLIHFFHESNIRLKEDDFPTVKILPGTLDLKMSTQDPNENIVFP